MTKTIKGNAYSITTNEFGWGVVSLAAKTDRFHRSYQVFRASNGAPVRCSCPDQTNRGGVCKHMNAIIEEYMPSNPNPEEN